MISSLYTIFATSTVQLATHRIGSSWEWYVIRASGFVAAGLLFLLMISGIGHVTGYTYRFIEPVKAWVVHKAMAIALCVSIVIHVSFLLLDHFVSFSVPQVLIPFVSKYSNGTSFLGLSIGSLSVTFGILAAYGVVIIVLSSLGWINTRKRQWRLLHYLSYLVIFFIFLHGLYVGSDLKYGSFRKLWILAGAVIAIAVVYRLSRMGGMKDKELD